MKRKTVVVMTALLIVVFVAACGGGGGGGAVGESPLAGTWFGVLEDAWGDLHTIRVTVNADNTVTGEQVDGVGTGVTYTIAAVPGRTRIYSYTGSDGTNGGFYVDSSYTYAVYVSDDFYFAVVQKGATSLPTYTTGDVVGSWSGFSVEVDWNLNITDTYTSSATVAANLSISGSNKYGSFSGSFTGWVLAYGGFEGTVNPGSQFVHAFVTPDKKFAGSYSCIITGGYIYLDDCTFSAWTKQ